MNRVVIGLCLASAAALFACGGSVEDRGDGDDTDSVGTASTAVIWTPLPDPWTDCTVGSQICLCSGDVVDCRNPRPIPPKTAATRTFTRSSASSGVVKP